MKMNKIIFAACLLCNALFGADNGITINGISIRHQLCSESVDYFVSLASSSGVQPIHFNVPLSQAGVVKEVVQIGDDTWSISMHINPSLESFYIVDFASSQVISSPVGEQHVAMVVDRHAFVATLKTPPHFTPEEYRLRGEMTVLINGLAVFSTGYVPGVQLEWKDRRVLLNSGTDCIYSIDLETLISLKSSSR